MGFGIHLPPKQLTERNTGTGRGRKKKGYMREERGKRKSEFRGHRVQGAKKQEARRGKERKTEKGAEVKVQGSAFGSPKQGGERK